MRNAKRQPAFCSAVSVVFPFIRTSSQPEHCKLAKLPLAVALVFSSGSAFLDCEM